MLPEEYREFLRRADAASSVRELRVVADEAKAAHPGDPEAELIDQTCFMYATALIERQAELHPFADRERAIAPGRVADRNLGRMVPFPGAQVFPSADKPLVPAVD